MKQLISRIDDDLHQRLKERATREGRSLNDLVADVLAAAVLDRRESFSRRLERSGLRVLPPAPMQRSPSLDDVLDANRGSGTAVSDALQAERDAQ
ncbi:MAG: FitA-like ribbon-helix-helix domain-containing protein [Pseudonocardiales bacterium]